MDTQRHPLDGLMSSDEELQAQITELSLLSRAEQQHLSTPRNFSSSTNSDAHGQSGRSTLSVLLSASSKLVNESKPLCAPTPSASPLRSVFSPAKTRRELMLPTLSEDDAEESTDIVPETEADSPDNSAENEEMVNCRRGLPPKADNFGDQSVFQEAREERTDQCDDQEEEQNDHAFEAMLEQLSRNTNSLTLSVSDLTPRKLNLVRETLLEPSRSEDSDQQQPSGLSTSRQIALPQIKRMRTIMALDTIGLLLQGYPRQEISVAIATAVRRIFTQYAQEQGVQSLANAPIVLTTSNITRVVLIARQSLLSGEYSRCASTRETSRDQMTGSVRKYQAGVSLTFDTKSVKSPASIKSSEPRRTTVAAPRQKSILATEGVHVLMQEKIAAFKYRATTGSPASGTFKIRRESAASADLAAQRRFKSLAYGKEHSRSYARNGSASSTY